MACASLVACDKNENDRAEMAALEKLATDNRFVERLSEMLVDPETNLLQAAKLDEEGTYAIGTEDGEIARTIVIYLMEEAESVVAEDEESYGYVYTFTDGRKVETSGSLQSSGGVYVTLRLEVEEMPDVSTLLIKTEAALQDDNGGAISRGRKCYLIGGEPCCHIF